MRSQQSKAAGLAMLAIVLAGLSACGGGGGSAGDTPTAQPLSTTYPSVKPTVGDYYIFTATSTVTTPTGTAPTTSTSVRTYPTVNSDGSYTRAVTGASIKQARDYAADGKVTTSTSTSQQCVYSPGYLISPPAGTAVGQAYSGTTGQTCTFTGSSVPSTSTLSTNGTADAIESVTTVAGTFRAFKQTATYVTTTNGYVSTTVETCWTDMVLGRTVKCSTSYSTVQPDLTVVSAGSSVSELTAYSVAGAAPVGSTLPRFVGSWRVNFAGAATGNCGSVSVTTAGVINTSACVRTNSSGSVIGNFTVSGSVDVNGVVTATGSDGSSFAGSLTSPTAGTGTWVNGSMSGTWTASHL